MKRQGNRPDFGSCLAPKYPPEAAVPSRTQAGSLCYINAVAYASVGLTAIAHQDGSESSLKSPENPSILGFQPVFFLHRAVFPTIRLFPPSCVKYKAPSSGHSMTGAKYYKPWTEPQG